MEMRGIEGTGTHSRVLYARTRHRIQSDPACGSGAFLIEAFDQLLTTYQAANEHYATLAG